MASRRCSAEPQPAWPHRQTHPSRQTARDRRPHRQPRCPDRATRRQARRASTANSNHTLRTSRPARPGSASRRRPATAPRPRPQHRPNRATRPRRHPEPQPRCRTRPWRRAVILNGFRADPGRTRVNAASCGSRWEPRGSDRRCWGRDLAIVAVIGLLTFDASSDNPRIVAVLSPTRCSGSMAAARAAAWGDTLTRRGCGEAVRRDRGEGQLSFRALAGHHQCADGQVGRA